MTSSAAAGEASNAGSQRVPILSAEEITRLLPPPYDLIKLDIEGGEYEFLAHYQEVLRGSRHLILEWHSWHAGGGGEGQLREMVEAQGLRFVADVLLPEQAAHRHGARTSGVHLYSRS